MPKADAPSVHSVNGMFRTLSLPSRSGVPFRCIGTRTVSKGTLTIIY
ncbi:hypothetical protein JW960_19035 [candidate division KSB1 bacterium]|nr:hypothetical protein [candidate division KSB1 bacterium]